MSAPALALLNAAGQVERSSETFRLRYAGSADAWRGSPDFERVLAGEADRATTRLGDAPVEIEALLDQDGRRRVLLTIGGDAAAGDGGRNALLDEPLDDCHALVWIKDLEGRYLRVNNRYTAFLDTSEDRLRGRMDTEVPARETVDGPRSQGRDDAIEEPLELEYVVAPFEGRPALSALRFAIRDRAGEPVAVCGVASPLAETAMAHAEAKRLIEVERFSRLDPQMLRAEFLHANGAGDAAAAPPSGTALPPRPTGPSQDRVEIDEAAITAAADRAAAVAEREELARELAEAQRRLAEHAAAAAQPPDPPPAQAEAALSGALAERDAALSATAGLKEELDAQRRELSALHEAAATARGRAEELDRTLSAERERNQEVERALAQARTEAEAARSDAERARREQDAARAEAQRALTRAQELENELQRSRAHADDLRNEAQRAQAEADVARGRADELGREHAEARERLARLEQKLEFEASDSDRHQREIEDARAEAERARAEVERTRAEAERTRAEAERAAAEADEARTEAEQASADAEHARSEAEQARGEAAEARAELDQLRANDPQRGDAAAENGHLAAGPIPAPQGADERAFSAIGDLARGLELENAARVNEQEHDPASSQDLVPGPEETGGPSSVQWLPNAQRRLSASLARMSVWRTVLNETSSIIGSEGGWDAVAAWVPDGNGGLECAAMWTAHPGLARFEEATWDAQQQRPGSLPAQALEAPHLTWVTEIDSVDDDRLRRAAAHGLRSALLLPVRDGSAPIALLELLAHASINPDAQIAMSLEAAALQLGQLGHLLHVGG